MEKKKSRKLMIQAVLFAIFLCACLGLFVYEFSRIQIPVETFLQEPEGKEQKQDQTAEEKTEKKEWKRTWQTDQTILVAVPVESLPLRRKAGFGKDVIKELKAGELMVWEGEVSKIDQVEFYKVKLLSSRGNGADPHGLTGFVPARYCIPVEFWEDSDALTVVNTSSALYTYREMEEDLKILCDQYPDILSSSVIGTSADGRNLYGVLLGNSEAPFKVMVQAGIHGREYMTTQLIMKMLEYYAFHYEEAGYGEYSYRYLLDQVSFYIVPMSNPDGVTISQLGVDSIQDENLRDIVAESYKTDSRDRYSEAWKLSYEEYQRIWKANARGVDLNNNFDAGWSKMGLKSWTSFENHKGSEAESEPESRALAEFAREHDFDYYISYHSKGQLIYYDAPGNQPDVSEASTKLARLLDSKIKYKPVSTKKSTYVNLGGFSDYAQLALNKPSVTIETGQNSCPLGIEEFPSMWYRNRESWAFLANAILQEAL